MGVISRIFTRHVVLDLETTGLDPVQDEVIELGALFVERGQVVEKVGMLFGCRAPLPAAIQRITGLTDADLAGQPPFCAYLPTLRQKLAGWTVVAHNAAFEQSFLAEVLQEVRAPVLDSCELLHFLYPELDSHSLEAIVQWAGVSDGAAHRALRDCEDTFQVLRWALARCATERSAGQLRELLDGVRGEDAPAPLVAALEVLLSACPEDAPVAPGAGSRLKEASRRPPSPEADGGLMLVHAPVQGSRLEAVVSCSRDLASQQGRPVALGVGSHWTREWLERRTQGLGGVALKDQADYLCRRRAEELTRVEPDMPYEERAPRAYLRQLLRRSSRGELDRLSFWFRRRFPALSPLAAACRSEPLASLGRGCPFFSQCYFHRAVEDAGNSALAIVPATLAANWPNHLPALGGVAFPAAHELEEHLSSAHSVLLTSEALDGFIQGFEDRRLGLLRRVTPLADARALAGLRSALAQLGGDIGEVGRSLAKVCGVTLDGRAGWPIERRVDASMRGTQAFASLGEALAGVTERLVGCAVSLARAGTLAERGTDLDGLALGAELAAAERRARQLLAAAREVLADEAGRCPSLRVDAVGRWALESRPVDVAPLFQALPRAPGGPVVLGVAEGTAAFSLRRLGIQPTPQPASAPRARRRPLLILVQGAPRAFDEGFGSWASAHLGELASTQRGATLALFGSVARLEEVQSRAAAGLAAQGIEVRRALRAWARRESAPLPARTLVLGSFRAFEGDGLPGQRWSSVFIDKLPIEPLGRSLVAAREEAQRQGPATAALRSYRLERGLAYLASALEVIAPGLDASGAVFLADAGSPFERAQIASAVPGYEVRTLPWNEALTGLGSPPVDVLASGAATA